MWRLYENQALPTAVCDIVCGRWRFAYDFIVGEHVKRRRDMWSWEKIRTHRQFFHEYKRLWIIKLKSYMMSTYDRLDIEVFGSHWRW